MQMCLLVEDKMLPIPSNITVNENYGRDSVVDYETERRVFGDVCIVTAEPEAIKDWLRPFDGIWKTNSPMAGHWEVVHIKD